MRPRTIAPIETGPDGPEALSSWVQRIALDQSLKSHVFVRDGLLHDCQPPRTHLGDLFSLNGLGSLATMAVRGSLQNFMIDPTNLTLLSWEGLNPKAHGALCRSTRWCPECWTRCDELNIPRYLRLLWMLKPVTACPIHEIALDNQCPKCAARQRAVGRLPYVDHCQSCGEELLANGKPQTQATEDDLWTSRVCLDLIELSLAQGGLRHSDFIQSFNAFLETEFDGVDFRAAPHLATNQRQIALWKSGTNKPSLPLLLSVTRTAGLTPSYFFDRNIPLPLPIERHSSIPPKARLVSKKHLTKTRLQKAQAELHQLIADGKAASLGDTCTALGISISQFRNHFPEHASAIAQGWREDRHERSEERRRRRIAELLKTARALRERGIYPSDRALRAARSGLGDFRDNEIQETLHEIRDDALLQSPDP